MINWFMALTIDHQSLVIIMIVVVIEAIVVIGASCPRKATSHEELQQKQEKMIGKMN